MEKYRVTVERLTPAADGVGDDYTTVVELTASREQLANFAPGVVAESLGANTVTVSREPAGPRPADEDDPGTEPDAPSAPKRKRRTKAEIAADAARAAAGNGAAVRPDPPADPDDKTYGEQATASAPVPAEQPLATGGIVAPANQTPAFEPPAGVAVPPTPTQTAAAPGGYNPFIKQ